MSSSPRSTRYLLFVACLSCFACNGTPTSSPDATSHTDAGPSGPDAATSEPAAPVGWDDELALGTLKDLDPAADVVDIELEARVAKVEVSPGQQVEMWTYGGQLPGPMIRVKVGDRLIVHFKNALPEETTIHWHGLEIPNDMDGAEPVQGPVPPGGSFDYDFIVPRAGTFWYHPHRNSSAQLWNGLYGALIVEDPAEPKLGREVVVVLDDLLLDGNGQLASPEANGNLGDFFGREGDTHLVNGRVAPTLLAHPGDALRLRFINASNSHYYSPAVTARSLVRIGGDGGLIATPIRSDQVPLTPGERADVVLIADGVAGETLSVVSRPYPRYECGDCWPEQALFSIQLVEGPASGVTIPTSLRTIEAIDTSAAITQHLTVQESSIEGNAVIGFNGKYYPDGLELVAAVGDTQVWTLDNPTDYAHPFHLHGFRFQVLSRGGTAPAVREWKDTVNLAAASSTQIGMQIDDRPGMWMFHCHILDHAKIGMMGMLHVHAQ